jgi:hypothetical protein
MPIGNPQRKPAKRKGSGSVKVVAHKRSKKNGSSYKAVKVIAHKRRKPR